MPSELNEIMLKKIAFWHVAITATLLVIVLAGGAMKLYAVVVVLIGIGLFIIKNMASLKPLVVDNITRSIAQYKFNKKYWFNTALF